VRVRPMPWRSDLLEQDLVVVTATIIHERWTLISCSYQVLIWGAELIHGQAGNGVWMFSLLLFL
jgi:hypothetical protein